MHGLEAQPMPLKNNYFFNKLFALGFFFFLKNQMIGRLFLPLMTCYLLHSPSNNRKIIVEVLG
jgi:hypothetical protein